MSAALKLELFQNGALLREIAVEGEVLWLGRGEECAIRVEDRAISRKHAAFRPIEGGIHFEKRSKFGEARLGGRDIESATLKSGDALQLGAYELRVVKMEGVGLPVSDGPVTEPVAVSLDGPAEGVALGFDEGQDLNMAEAPSMEEPSQDSGAEPGGEESPDFLVSVGGESGDGDQAVAGVDLQMMESSSDSPAPDLSFGVVDEQGETRVVTPSQIETKPIFEFQHAEGPRAYEIVDPEIAIGRSQNCHVVLEDKKSSRKHAILLRQEGKFLLRDLGSSNGTLVNGTRIEEHELASGDEIQIGDTRFVFKQVQADYEAKKAEFLQVPEEAAPPPVPEYAAPMEPLSGMGDFGGALADPVMFETSPQDPPVPNFAAPEEASQGILGGFLNRFRAMPFRMQLIYGAAILAGVWFFLEEPTQESRPTLVMGQGPSSPAKKPERKTDAPSLPTFESLTPEQQAYVESQYNIAFEYYRNREYDSALLELDKIFALVQTYKGAREIEAFAKEGKRTLERFEEDRKRQEQERQAQIRLQSLIDQAGLLMDAQKYKDAEALFPEIELLQPENSVVANWRKRIIEENERLEQQEKEKARLAEIRRRSWADYDQAQARLKAGNYFGALDLYDELASRDGLEKELIEKIQKDIRTAEDSIAARRDPLIAKGQELEKAMNYPDAYKAYALAAKEDPTDEVAPAGMERIRGVLTSKAKAVYSEGVIAESFSEFDLAEKKYREVLEIVPPEHDYFSKAARRIKRILSARKPASESGPQ
jgi:pSer/pThr/pTyr-binding forkhead associated (FHA) protein/tetratricopeptide (TPR) repeat protein